MRYRVASADTKPPSAIRYIDFLSLSCYSKLLVPLQLAIKLGRPPNGSLNSTVSRRVRSCHYCGHSYIRLFFFILRIFLDFSKLCQICMVKVQWCTSISLSLVQSYHYLWTCFLIDFKLSGVEYQIIWVTDSDRFSTSQSSDISYCCMKMISEIKILFPPGRQTCSCLNTSAVKCSIFQSVTSVVYFRATTGE